MQRIQSYGFGQVLPSADLDTMQDNMAGLAQIPGLMLGPPYVYSNDGVSVKIGAITFLNLESPNATLLTTGEATYTPTSPALAINKLYHLFAYNIAGAIAFEHVESSVGFPDAALVFRSGDTTRRYLCSFVTRTTTAATIMPFRFSNGRTIFQLSAFTDWNDFIPVDGLGDPAYQTLSLVNWLPSHARIAILNLDYRGASISNEARIVTGGNTSPASACYHKIVATVTTTVVSKVIEVVTNSSQAVAWRTSSGSDLLTISVLGYQT